MTLDAKFAGSIPSLYQEYLVPVLFAPFAKDLVARARALESCEVLELAAGTGVVSHLLAKALPKARIVATDLNPAMLEVAQSRGQVPNLSFEQADAQSLPFAENSFDLVLVQFGAMFFPDKIGAGSRTDRWERRCRDCICWSLVNSFIGSWEVAFYGAVDPGD